MNRENKMPVTGENRRNATKMIKRALRRGLLSLAMGALLTPALHAQISQNYYGGAATEVALDTKALQGGGKIVVGYTAPNSGSNGKDALITQIGSNNQVQWSRKIVTQNNDVLSRVVITADGGYVAVGYRGYTGTTSAPSEALIVKYDNTGALLWASALTDNNNFGSSTSTVGDVFNDVKELSNGNIVAVGARDWRGYYGNGMASMFDASGTTLWHNVYYKDGNSDELFWVNELANGTIITGGVYQGNSYSDGTVFNITQAGALLSSFVYDFSLTGATGATLGSNDPRVSFVFPNDDVVIGGHASQNYSVGAGTNPFIMRFRFNSSVSTLNTSLVLRSFNASSLAHCNGEKIFALDADDIILSQNPDNSLFLLNSSYPLLNLEGHIARVSLSTSTINLSKKISLPGNQTILGLDVRNSRVYGVGAVIDDAGNQFGNHDIYSIESDLAFSEYLNCEVADADMEVTAVDCQMEIEDFSVQAINPDGFSPVDADMQLENKKICGDDGTTTGDCNEDCYWTLNGNTITSGKYLGTNNNMDLRLKTNGTQQAVLSANGDFGIATPTPTARLHVDCANPPNGSNIRFENLPWGEGVELVIDNAGYVYKKLDDGSDGMTMREEMEQLKSEISQLKEQLGVVGQAKKNQDAARIITAAPNPAKSYAEISYYTPAGATNCAMLLQDVYGRTLKTIDITNTGSGSVTFQLGEYPAQQFIISLHANGHTADTRKLTKN